MWIHIKQIIKDKIMKKDLTDCPMCGAKEAHRILRDGRYYIYCVTCGADVLCKTISAMKKEMNDIYDK